MDQPYKVFECASPIPWTHSFATLEEAETYVDDRTGGRVRQDERIAFMNHEADELWYAKDGMSVACIFVMGWCAA